MNQQDELDDALVVKSYAPYTRRTMVLDVPLPVGKVFRADTVMTSPVLILQCTNQN
jgi:hypothetical protein